MKRCELTLRRRELLWTALQLAEIIGYPESSIYQVERGRHKPPLPVAVRWAHALGLTLGEAFPEPLKLKGGEK